jgi:hypothetical protein
MPVCLDLEYHERPASGPLFHEASLGYPSMLKKHPRRRRGTETSGTPPPGCFVC